MGRFIYSSPSSNNGQKQNITSVVHYHWHEHEKRLVFSFHSQKKYFNCSASIQYHTNEYLQHASWMTAVILEARY